jgi:hypothetical protein
MQQIDTITNQYSNVPPNPNTNIAIYFALKGASSGGSSDGFNVFGLTATNTVYGFIGNKGNSTNSNVAAIVPNVWQYLALSGGETAGIGAVSVFVDGNLRFKASDTTAIAGTNTLGISNFLLGGQYSGTTISRVSPKALMDEYRLSLINRSSNWLFTENTNFQGADTNLFYYVTPSGYAKISNVIGFPYPSTGTMGAFALDRSSLSLPYRYSTSASGSNYITNIAWTFTNLDNGANIYSNVSNGCETNFYIISNVFPSSGTWKVIATILDVSNTDPILATFTFTVASSPSIWDLSKLQISQTNQGILIDLFQGQDGNASAHTNVTFIRNGKVLSLSRVTNYSYSNVFLDDNFPFYDTSYTYTATLNYSSASSLSNVTTVSFSEPAYLTNVIVTAGQALNRTLQNFYLQLTVPEGTVSSSTRFFLQKPSDIKITPSGGLLGSARNELVFGSTTGSPTKFFDYPINATYNLPIVSGKVAIPNYSFDKWPYLSEKEKLVFGFWTGSEWRTIATAYNLVNSNGVLQLSASLTESGRIGLMLSSEAISVSNFAIRSRMLILNSTDLNYNQMFFTFRRDNQESASIAIQDLNGKTIFSKDKINNNTYGWDGIGNDKKAVKPGIYIYLITVGSAKFKGSFVVVQP